MSGGSAVGGVVGALAKRILEKVVVITNSSDDVGGGVAQSSSNHCGCSNFCGFRISTADFFFEFTSISDREGPQRKHQKTIWRGQNR